MTNMYFPNVHERVLRIKTTDIAAVTTAIPDARPVEYHPDGTVWVDVDWTFDNMTKLSLAGQPAVSTIFDGYAFNGRNRPYYHQLRIAEFLSRNPRAYCFAGMGTGKTRSACWAMDYLMSIGIVGRVLVVCPKSLMYSAWVDDIMATCIGRRHCVLYGDSKKRKELARRDTTEIDIINFDGVEIISETLEANNYDLIIIDESTAYKDPSTKRWKALAKLITPQTRVWALTGTPTPQGAMDAYGQGKLVNPARMPRSKTAYRDMVQFKVSTFIWRDKRGWQDTVNHLLQPSIYIRKADCLDLPPVTRSYLDVGLSKAQTLAIKAMVDDMVANFDTGHQAVAANAAVLHGKLRQIYAGAIYADDGTAMALENQSRIDATLDLIRQARESGDDSIAEGRPHSKALVFVPFKHVMTVLEGALRKHFDVAVISGDTSVHERRRILDSFQQTATPEVILAIPEAFSHGVTATAASLTVWYAPPSRTETYLQACERMDRPSQTQHMNIVHLYGDKREREMYQHLADNKQNQETLLQLYYDTLGIKKGQS